MLNGNYMYGSVCFLVQRQENMHTVFRAIAVIRSTESEVHVSVYILLLGRWGVF